MMMSVLMYLILLMGIIEIAIIVDAVCEKEYIWKLFFQMFFFRFFTDVADFKGSLRSFLLPLVALWNRFSIRGRCLSRAQA